MAVNLVNNADNSMINSIKESYKKYVNNIIGLENHINRLYNEWIINADTRNKNLKSLNSLIIKTHVCYNEILEISCKMDEIDPEDIISSGFRDLHNIDCINRIFNPIRKEITKIAKNNGHQTIIAFIGLFMKVDLVELAKLSNDIFEQLELYNKVYVPYAATHYILDDKMVEDSPNIFDIFVEKADSVCDCLIDNTCHIIITINNHQFILEGYVNADILNAYARTSKVCSKYLYTVKLGTRKIIKDDMSVSDSFVNKYFKLTNNNIYFSNRPHGLAQKIISDHQLFNEISGKNFNFMMKEFVNGDIKSIYRIIHLLLMGDEQCIINADLLFGLLKDKKVGSVFLSEIVYRNLSFYSQMKLQKASITVKNELAKLKSLNLESISIEKRLAAHINIPDNAKGYILEKMGEIKGGDNNHKVQMAVNGLMQFPWKPKDFQNDLLNIKKSLDLSRKYLENVATKLEENVYGHTDSKKALIELVGKWIQNPESTGQVIGLVGPPGVGKTLLSKSISAALGIPLSIIGLGGMNDSADLIGHSFTYSGAQYGMIIRQMIKAGSWRSVMFFDEVDKVSRRNETNEIHNTLIHITDPNMNQHFQDRFYSSSVEFDLSGTLIVFSYNDSTRLDPILLDRIKEINISAYSTSEKIVIAQKHILKELCQNIGFDRSKIEFPDDIIRYIIEKYTIEAGVRSLRRRIEQILLKLNVDRIYLKGPFKSIIEKMDLGIELSESAEKQTINYLDGKTKWEEKLGKDKLDQIFNLTMDDRIIITQSLVHRYLEKPMVSIEKIHHENKIGVVNGMYATSIGMGGIIPIQIYKNYSSDDQKGTMKLKLTGNQKKVMKESVVCALTASINILSEKIKASIKTVFQHGFHIHAPDGGTPKDGPSAGCAFATAFISTILGKAINREVAMTGEIDLTGKISKIGGLDAKIAGAKRAGVKKIFICDENMEDYENIKNKSPELFDDLEIIVVSHILDIVKNPVVIIGVEETDFN